MEAMPNSPFCALIAALAFVAIPSQAAGFDCNLATERIHYMICGDPILSDLDSKLKIAFDDARSELVGIDGETGERIDPISKPHRAWLKARNKCPNVACVKAAYISRIKELKALLQEQ